MDIRNIDKDCYREVAQIYLQGISTGIATFQTTVADWEAWDSAHLPCCRTATFEDNIMVGWAALSPVSSRPVYAGVAEVSVYIAEKFREKGWGQKILLHLIEQSEKAGIWTLQAGIFRENKNSIALHKKCGFRIIGFREKVGCLHGVWKDNVMLERRSKLVGQS